MAWETVKACYIALQRELDALKEMKAAGPQAAKRRPTMPFMAPVASGSPKPFQVSRTMKKGFGRVRGVVSVPFQMLASGTLP